eukprot:COSAG04_NODE_1367_length_7063_cov_6.876508_4_plen_417_part_00
MRTAGALLAAPALFGVALGQPSHANPIDPRHHFDERCPKAVTLDAKGTQRDPSSTSSYLWTPMSSSATVEECARLCCGDWSCEAFAFVKPTAGPAPAPPADGSLTGDWLNHDSLRGVSQITMKQEGTQLTATSLQPHVSFWAGASGSIDGKRGFLTFGNSEDSKVNNNRSFTVSADNSELYLERLSFDPPGFTQNFTRATAPFGPGGNCTGSTPCCVFKDDIDKVVKSADSGVTTGRRAKLPARPPPYPNSTKVLGAVLHPKMESVPPIARWPSLLSDSVLLPSGLASMATNSRSRGTRMGTNTPAPATTARPTRPAAHCPSSRSRAAPPRWTAPTRQRTATSLPPSARTSTRWGCTCLCKGRTPPRRARRGTQASRTSRAAVCSASTVSSTGPSPVSTVSLLHVLHVLLEMSMDI